MANVQNKENMTISIREYQDNQGQTKKVWKTIGELITWDDGSKSFELWGPTGSVKGNVFAKEDPKQSNAPQQSNQQGGYQQNQQQGDFQGTGQQYGAGTAAQQNGFSQRNNQ